jgi:phi LC3 family holin
MINIKVRMKNKDFWIAFIPAVLILIQMILGLFNVTLPIDALTGKLLDIVNTIFLILGILGIVNDPTTHGMADSIQAMGYNVPKKSR